MKRIISLLISILLIFACAGCQAVPPTGMSPEETVRFYFKEFNNKNISEMNSVVCDDMKGAEYDVQDLNYVKLISCEEDKDDSYAHEYYPDAYETARVNVIFNIHYKPGYGGGFSNGEYEWSYHLIKEKRASDWVIVMWGAR